MQLQHLFALSLSSTSLFAAETLLGVYIVSRHGDRTPKSLPPTNLTSLGYSQVHDSGSYYRNRYVATNATSKIGGLNSDIARLSQIAVSAPQDNVLTNSAQAFLQGLYPPVGGDASEETLRNGSKVSGPLGGYQLIPVGTVASGAGSEDAAWLQGAGNCARALTSSNAYFTSAEYKSSYDGSSDFYRSLLPAVNGVFDEEDMNFKNAYSIFDLLNVALIHNTTLSTTLLPPPTTSRLLTLANTHEYGLAYNTSDPIRAISGAVLAAEILTALSPLLSTSPKAAKLNIQFGAYASFLSFFGLAGLPKANGDFEGINDYASTMAFEVITTAASPPPSQKYSEQDVSVRFLFNNGSSAPSPELTPYPLFGQEKLDLPWTDFVKGMKAFNVDGQEAWCRACGNSTGVCASSAPVSTSANSKSSGNGEGGVSRPVAGVIGAMVTLAVVLGVEAAVLLAAGLRVVRRRRGVDGSARAVGGEKGVNGGRGSE